MVLVVKNPPANTGDLRDAGSIPGSERSPREGNGNPLQYSCLENSMDSGAWQATVHRVAKCQTRLKRLSMLDARQIAAKSLQSCPTSCDPIDGSPPGSPVPGILQARTLEWVAISFSNAWKWKVKGKSLSRVWLFTTPWTTAYQAPLSMGFSRQEYWSGVPSPSPTHVPMGTQKVKAAQSCLTLCDPMDCSLPGSPVHGIFQARVLEWGAISFSKNIILVIHKYQIIEKIETK